MLNRAQRRAAFKAVAKGKVRLPEPRRIPRTRLTTLDIIDAANGHDGPATPPTEFRIFRAGVNSSEKGDFLFDEQAAKSVIEHAARYANRFVIDYCHASLASIEAANPAESGKAAGWFRPEIRNGELWACDVSWTAQAASYISQREYVYFSPAFNVDEDERVIELTNVALTNIPAMHDLNQLVAASRRVTMSKDEMKKSIHECHSKMHGAMHDEAAKAHLDALMDSMKMDELKSYHEHLMGFMPHKEPDGDEGGGDGDDDGDEKKAPPPADKKADEKHDDAKADEAADKKADDAEDKKDMKHSRADTAPLMARIVELENKLVAQDKQRETDARSELLSRAQKDAKLTPADVAGETSRGKFIKSLSLSQLTDYIAECGKVASTSESRQGDGKSGNEHSGVFQVELTKGEKPIAVTLSRHDMAIARKFKTPLESFARTRALELRARPVEIDADDI